MRRVAVVGPGGAGKSTFARELGRRSGLPVVHLDRYYWRPGWVETPPEQWREVQAALVADDEWIADGNYGGTLDVRLARADTVVVFALPPWRCLLGVLTRWARNHGRAVQAAGCPERVDRAFARWIWRWPRDSRPRLDAALARHRDHLEVVELTSHRQAARFLARIG